MTTAEALEKFYAALETAKEVNGHVVVTAAVGEVIKKLLQEKETLQ